MGNRRKARETSLQLLYEIDLGSKSSTEVIGAFRADAERLVLDGADAALSSDDITEFTSQITEGVWSNVHEIDRLIEMHSTHWKISRMALVDRNILRMAVFELLYCADIPASVTINEAIEIAKKFGTTESSRFINGVLDRILREQRATSA